MSDIDPSKVVVDKIDPKRVQIDRPQPQMPKQTTGIMAGLGGALSALTTGFAKPEHPVVQSLASSLMPIKQVSTPQIGKIPSLTFPVPGYMAMGAIGQQPTAQAISGETSPLALAGTALGLMGDKGFKAEDINKGIEAFRAKPTPESTPNVVDNLVKWTNPQKQLDLANEARSGLVKAKHDIVESFGEDYSKYVASSDKTIKLNNAIDGLKTNAQDGLMELASNEDFAGSLAKNQPMANRINNLIKSFDESKINEISVQEADKLQKWIKQLPGIKSKLNQVSKSGWNNVDWTNSERVLLDFANDLKSSVINEIPKLATMNREYGATINAIKGARTQLGFGTATENLSNFSKSNIEIKNAFIKAIPQTTEKIQQMSQSIQLARLLKSWGMKGLGAVGLGGLGATGFELAHVLKK